MVNLTRIYTRTGDGGTTRLGDMSETTKTDLRLEAYADVDETNAHLGVVLATGGTDGPGGLDDDVEPLVGHLPARRQVHQGVGAHPSRDLQRQGLQVGGRDVRGSGVLEGGHGQRPDRPGPADQGP